jgi:potassium-dependent mechanosensitive channel
MLPMKKSHLSTALSLGALLLIAIAIPLSAAESDNVEKSTDEVSVDPLKEALDSLQQNLQAVEAKEDLEADLKGKLLEAYKSAENFYQIATKHSEQEQAYLASITSAPDTSARFQNELKSLGDIISTNAVLQSLPAEITVEELEQRFTAKQADLVSREGALVKISEQISQQKLRPETIRERQTEIATALGKIEEGINSSNVEADPFRLPFAIQAELIAQKAARQAEVAMLDQERISLPLRLARAVAESDLITKQVANGRVEVETLESELIKRRLQLAEQQQRDAEEARRDAVGKHPLLAVLAKEVETASQDHTKLQLQIDEVLKQELDRSKQKGDEVKSNFDRAKEQINLVGLSDSLAVLLLDQWRRLPNLRTNRAALGERKARIGNVGLERFELEGELRDLPDSKNREKILAWASEQYTEAAQGADGAEIWVELEKMIDSKRSVLVSLIADNSRLLKGLGDLDFEENKHISLVEEYTGFLEERLLWIPNTATLRMKTIGEVSESIGVISSVGNRVEIVSAAKRLIESRPVFSGALGLLLLVSIGSRSLVRRKEQLYLTGVKRISTDSFAITLRATFLLLLQSAPFAAVLALLGRHLVERESNAEILRGLGVSLVYASIYLFGILVLLNACRSKGLGQVHFRWDAGVAGRVRRQLFWFLPVVMLTTVLVDLTEELSGEFHRSGLGRMALIGLLVASSIMLHRTFRPDNGVLSGILRQSSNGWLVRLQHVWFWGLVLLPLGLALLSAFGYHHTAVQLTRRAAITISFLVGAFIIHQLIWRWFVAKERKLQLEKWLEQRRASTQTKKSEGGSEESNTALPEINEDELDLKSLNEQTKRLLSSLMSFSLLLGVWLIWADFLPALNVLNSVELWDSETLVDGKTVLQPVTLNHLALGLIILVITSVVVRNISGILEIGILQNLPLAAGSRYAIVSVVQYALVMLGAVFIFNVLGFSLAQFGWMMAALSVGLGFGLQEVVANFVSGVILLAERPIRVGDIVTVSDVSGIVTRIRIRATTITNWDRQELVVPNKEFITGRILNWTLSNTVNRIVITVGVAYGSDTDQARNLLLDVANKHPLIMKEPGPMATFEGFDDSTLRLVLRCYLPNLDNRLSVITELHTAIDQAYKEAGIEISFPQQDIHVRTSPPEWFNGPGAGSVASES